MFLQRSFSKSELLTEGAGIAIIMTATPAVRDIEVFAKSSSRERVVLPSVINGDDGGADDKERKYCGFHLTRSKWDPYPWVGFVEPGSIAHVAGLRAGDCLLDVCGRDVVGLRVKEIATLIQNRAKQAVDLEVWRSPEVLSCGVDDAVDEEIGSGGSGCDGGVALQGPLPDVARRLANAVSGAVRALECPVCLESAAPPVSQCVHGHILCTGCRSRTERCPVCRVRLGQGRCLLADKVHGSLKEAFDLGEGSGARLGEKLFGRTKPRNGRRGGGKFEARESRGSGPRHLLARLFLNVGAGGGGLARTVDHRAASAENLSLITSGEVDERKNLGSSTSMRLTSKRLGELTASDRAKSASTGELANPAQIRTLNSERQEFPSSSNPDVTSEQATRYPESLLSVPRTPTWAGSTESISNTFVRCPLAPATGCAELVTPGFLLEHLGTAHHGPQIHFYAGNATVPVSTPLGPDAIYVLHHAGEMFFFKCDEEAASIVTAVAGARHWDWILRGYGVDGTEVKLRRSVATLEDQSLPLTPQQIAPLPKALDISTVEIQLTEARSDEIARM